MTIPLEKNKKEKKINCYFYQSWIAAASRRNIADENAFEEELSEMNSEKKKCSDPRDW